MEKVKQFFKENKIFLGIIVGALIVGAAIHFSRSVEKAPNGDGGDVDSTLCSAEEEVMVTRVLDGDTVIVEGGHHVRLLGIDADERGYPCYEEAKIRLEELVLNKKVRLEKDKTDTDQYDRCLRHLFSDRQNIGLQLVKEGRAICRFYEPDTKYREGCAALENEAKENKVGCKWSSSAKATEDRGQREQLQWDELTTAKLGYDVVGVCQAGKYLGRELIIEGKVADTYHALESNTVFLNFEKAYPNQCFTGVIFSSDLYKFVQNPENYYLNKTVRVMGEIKEYEGRPEIILETPNQIEVGK